MRAAFALLWVLALGPSVALGQTIKREPSAWYEALSKEFRNPSLRVQVGTGRFGPGIAAVFGDSQAVSSSWEVQQPLAKEVAKFILAHVDSTPPLGVVNVAYEFPHFAGPNVLRVFRFLPPAPGDTLADAIMQ